MSNDYTANDTRISIHAPVRERPGGLALCPIDNNISIHAPVRERLYVPVCSTWNIIFQFTLP